MSPYKYPEHVPQEPQPDWITTDTIDKETDMEQTLDQLLEKLTEQTVALLETLEALKNANKNTGSSVSEEELNTTKMMLEAERQRADAAEKKLKVIMGALNA